MKDEEEAPSREVLAHALARGHRQVRAVRVRRDGLDRRIDVLEDVHRSVAARFEEAGFDSALGGAAEWFLDNQHLVLEALEQVRNDLPPEFYRELPRLVDTGRRDDPRALAIARALVEEGEGHVDSTRAEATLIAYQEVTPLSMGELWAIPPMLRLALLEDLAVSGAKLVEVVFHDRTELEKIGWEAGHIPVEERVPGGFQSLRAVGATDWKRFFEAVSRVDRELRDGDPLEVYGEMDFDTRDRYRKCVEKIAKRSHHSEEEVARAAVDAAREKAPGPASRRAHVGYHLIGPGRLVLEQSLGARMPLRVRLQRVMDRAALGVYLGVISLATAVVLGILILPLIGPDASLVAIGAVLLLGAIPGSAVGIAVVNWLFTVVLPIRTVPKLEYEGGIPEGSRTAVVVPAMLSSEDDIDRLVRQLELNRQGNADGRLRYVLLTDFPDAPHATMPEDETLLERARSSVEELNRRHGDSTDGPFLLLHRPRRWNASEGCWMGWERKRGKLTELNRLIVGQGGVDLEAVVGDPKAVIGSRYVITLDADTFLPRGTARRLVGAFDHPLNRPDLGADGQLMAGYTVLQPRIETYPARVRSTLFTRIFEADRGLDLYSRAVSDVYQDLFGTGIYVGKGIYDVAAFEANLRHRIPENALLSHDLFEGIHGRTALLTDVTLFEDFPDGVLTYFKRLHRWVRGDWQIAGWLAPRVRSEDGRRIPNRIDLLGRWMILDNLRRSLLFPSLLALGVGGALLLPDPPWWWLSLALLALAVPVVLGSPVFFRIRASVSPGWAELSRGKLLRATGLSRWLLAVALMPYRAYVEADAIVRTLVRMFVTRRHLLEWKTQAETDRLVRAGEGPGRYWLSMAPGPLFGIALALAAATLRPGALPVLSPLALLWVISPAVARWVSRAPRRHESALREEEVRDLRLLARRTWHYYEDLVGPEDHWLPPDHFQEDPRGEPAHRTSPTNMGLMLAACFTAYDLGYLTPSELVARLVNSFEEMEKLERYRGHFLNWYGTRDLSSLLPRYVSVVDSGNLAGCLVAVREGLSELTDDMVPRTSEADGLADTFEVLCETVEAVAAEQVLEEAGWHSRVSQVLEELRSGSARPREAQRVERPLEDRGLPLLEDVLRRLASGDASRVDPGALTSLRGWSARLRRQIAEVKRDRAALMPWMDFLAEPPEWLEAESADHPAIQAYRQLVAHAPSACRIGDVADVCAELALWLLEIEESVAGASGAPTARSETARAWVEACRVALRHASDSAEDILEAASGLRAQSATWLRQMDFSFLYRPDQKLFHIGFNVTSGDLDPSYYDLLASEARLASLIAIAKGDVQADHWLHLGRPFGRPDRAAVLLSWAGTSFEYLMPFLLNRVPEGSLLELSAHEAVQTHIRFGRRHGIPWGISESGYYELDTHGTYQYRAFGVADLAIRRDPADRLVVSPYASLLALPFAPREVARNVRRLTELGMAGRYGLYEAMDFGLLRGRLRGSGSGRIVRSFMAHHQAMILVAIGNQLDGARMVRRFHRDRGIEATEYLLYERAPGQVRLEPRPEPSSAREGGGSSSLSVESWNVPEESVRPHVQVLSNGALRVLVDERGGSGMQWKGRAMTRWRSDLTSSGVGTWIYVQDLDSDDLWSATTEPTGVRLGQSEVTFGPHYAEWFGVHRDIATRLAIAVPTGSDLEVRRLHLRNQGDERRRLRLTTYGEPVLTAPDEDRRHPAFSKLFVEARFEEEPPALFFRRRRASPSEPTLVLGHAIAGPAAEKTRVQWGTDRARFLGRGGSHQRPAAVTDDEPLDGIAGATLDPIFSLSVTVELDPGASTELLVLTAVGGTEAEVRSAMHAYRTPGRGEWGLSQARARARTRLQALGMDSSQARQAQRVLSTLLRPFHPGRRGAQPEAAAEPRRRALWALGISGDHPVLVVEVHDAEARALVLEAVRCHAWLEGAEVTFDLVVLDESTEGYTTPLLDWLRRTLRRLTDEERLGRPGGVHYVPSSRPTAAQKAALIDAASLRLSTDAGTLDEQLDQLMVPPSRLPPFVPVPSGPPTAEETSDVERPADLLFQNELGGFTPDGEEYVIHLEPGAHTPAPWVNVIATPDIGFTVSERGAGYTWALNSGEHRLSPWTNDPVLDSSGEAIYLRDEETGSIWSPTPGPAPSDAAYQIRHGAGHTRFLNRSHGLDQELRLFASHREAVKVVQLRLENLWSRPRRITITQLVEWVLGRDRAVDAAHVITKWDSRAEILLARNHFSRAYGPAVGFLTTDRRVHGWTADRREFLGEGGHADPDALHRIGLGEVAGAGLDPCGALQVHVDLKPGESRIVRFFLGAAETEDEAREIAAALRAPHAVEERLVESTDFWDDLLGRFTVKTPDAALDLLVNRWAPYQALSSRIWGRSALYQSSGAYGFRDQLQDVMAFLATRPEIAREHILESASRQFEEGDVLHWWHPPHGEGIRSRCSDDLLWLPWAVASYVEATDDLGILAARVPYLEGQPLPGGEMERYGEYAAGAAEGSLYEHCVRALEKGMTSGPHGLPLIGSGDWNDGMNRVGTGGRGESVWLGWFVIEVARRFAEVCDRRGDEERARNILERSEALRANLEAFAWEEDRYLRATYDDGTPLGSGGGEEDRLDSISQSWAVLSGAGEPARVRTAMDTVWRRLVQREDDLVLLLDPPFDRTGHWPGYIKAYPPGIRENGGQYTHAGTWVGWAFAGLGDGGRAHEVFRMLNPIGRARSMDELRRYRVEPYVVAADVGGASPHRGRGGWTWYTGSAAWMVRLAREAILGFHPSRGGFRLDPCIPPEWGEYEVLVRRGGATWRIRVLNPEGVTHGVRNVEVDGVAQQNDFVPVEDDGDDHEVTVRLGSPETAEARAHGRSTAKGDR